LIVLSIDTSTDFCSLGLVQDDKLLVDYRADFKRAHAEKLIGAVENVLKSGSIELSQVDGIAISLGPGSFTGLRIGLATAKGFCFAENKKIIGINTLDALAENVRVWNGSICSLIHAQANEFYVGSYESDSREISRVNDYEIIVLKDIVKHFSENVLFVSPHKERVIKYLKEKEIEIPPFAVPEYNYLSGVTIARLGVEKIKAGEEDDPHLLQPFYLKDFIAKQKGEHKIVRTQ